MLPAGIEPPPAADRHVQVTIAVDEGPRTLVGAVDLSGNMVLTAEQICASLATVPGKPYSEVDVASDRDRIDLEYRNRGYESVAVDPRVMLADANTRANILFTISEGPQVIVDHMIIIGNKPDEHGDDPARADVAAGRAARATPHASRASSGSARSDCSGASTSPS